ncbi:MAG: CHAT domain-containing protein [Acidobacteriota bacterium]
MSHPPYLLSVWTRREIEGRIYKRHEVARRYFPSFTLYGQPTTKVEVTLDLQFAQFSEVERSRLQYALAKFLDIELSDVNIRKVLEGSTKVIIDLPRDSAHALQGAFAKSGIDLNKYGFRHVILKIRQSDVSEGEKALPASVQGAGLDTRGGTRSLPSSSAAPVDLELRVTIGFRDGRTQLHYILHSPVGIDGFSYRGVDGPSFQGRVEEYRSSILDKVRKLGERIDTDDSLLLRGEIRRKLEALGQDLYRELFSGEMQLLYRKIRRSVTTLTIISDEPWIPWELVKPYDAEDPDDVIDDDFLCIQFELTRWLAGNRSPAAEIQVRRLACFTTSSELTRAEEEQGLVTDLARDHSGIEDATVPVASAEEIETILGKGGLDLLHFVGHGGFNPDQPNESALPLEDESFFRAGDLTGALATEIGRNRPLVFLNACWIGQQAWSLTGLGGWADRWVRVCGCGAFLGPAWPVRDSRAFEFARSFYGALAQGETFGRAARIARLALREADADDPAWLTYVIYAHANGRIALGDAPGVREPAEKRAPPEIQKHILDFTPLIRRKTEGYVGRQWLFDALDDFVQKSNSGYIQVLGDPGIGKTAIVARLAQLRRYPLHFNVRAEGITKPSQFLPNLCAQLIRDFDLGYSALPPEASRDPRFLKELLGGISTKLLASGTKLLFLVDALDEADSGAVSKGANTLYLPSDLPPGVFAVVTSRRGQFKLQFTCEGHTIDLQRERENNFADVRLFTQNYALRPGIGAYITAQGLDEATFVDELVKRSEGNFMYLHYVLPEIEKGAYKTRDLTTLPTGLQSYYEDQWERMKELDTQGWFEYKLPVLVGLTVAREPISTGLISDFSGIQDRARVQMALDEWSQFLQPISVEDGDDGPELRYRLYHDSFHDFIKGKDQVKEKGVDLMEANRRVADVLWGDLLSEE